MASTKYTYSISGDFPNQKIASDRLTQEINKSTIITALDFINTSGIMCDIWFKADLSSQDSTSLDALVATHTGVALPHACPTDLDGKPIVRADSRPLNTETYFTTAGDDQDIGDGGDSYFDFSNDDNLVDSTSVDGTTVIQVVPVGYKLKRMRLSFADPIYLKEGTVYFFNAPKKSYAQLLIVCPQGHYYYDRNLTPQQSSEDTPLMRYVNKHYFAGDCPMGDELNTEGCAINALPPNYELWCDIFVPDDNSTCYGWVSLEVYRYRSVLLPGESL